MSDNFRHTYRKTIVKFGGIYPHAKSVEEIWDRTPRKLLVYGIEKLSFIKTQQKIGF
jgi:hypothetical protein